MTAPYSVEAEALTLGNNVTIGEGAHISGGCITIGDHTHVGRDVQIRVTQELVIGPYSRIGDHSIIRGRHVTLGREFYTNHHAEIGGGSCFESTSLLEIGYWFHLGSYSIVNTAMPVSIGDEVGLGRFTNIYTHGAYLSAIDGFPVSFAPVTIGNRVWMPSATVNPGVSIGDDVVIGVGSLITRNIPSGSLALGSPCRVVKERAFPAPLDPAQAQDTCRQILAAGGVEARPTSQSGTLSIGKTVFDLTQRAVHGPADALSERARELLRRRGIRFKVEAVDGVYRPW